MTSKASLSFQEAWENNDGIFYQPAEEESIITSHITMDKNAWDDNIIMKLYHDAIAEHHTKGSGNRKRRKMESHSVKAHMVKSIDGVVVPIGEAGPWQPADEDSGASQAILVAVVGSESEGDCVDDSTQSKIDANAVPTSVAHSLPTSLSCHNSPELQAALDALLMSWYQAGYNRARYDALLEASMSTTAQYQASSASSSGTEE